MRNFFIVEHERGGILLARTKIHNTTFTEGKNHALDVLFSSATQNATWYLGLVKASPDPSYAASDTLASHPGWSEATGFTSARVAWDEASAASGSKGTNSASTFTANATDSIKGLFVCSAASGTSGILWAAGNFSTKYDLISGDTLRVSYTCNGF